MGYLLNTGKFGDPSANKFAYTGLRKSVSFGGSNEISPKKRSRLFEKRSKARNSPRTKAPAAPANAGFARASGDLRWSLVAHWKRCCDTNLEEKIDFPFVFFTISKGEQEIGGNDQVRDYWFVVRASYFVSKSDFFGFIFVWGQLGSFGFLGFVGESWGNSRIVGEQWTLE